ncbi:hypothetical protein HD806DRAFT_498763 [Xylariaceae sp. AK1471]|nr:hypothetical protein HD806DRAFT_498763 [Xylariaceae sp. AK1471]
MLSSHSTAFCTTTRGIPGEKATAAPESVQPRDRRRINMMPAMRTLLFTLFIGASITIGFTNATHFRARSWQEGSMPVEDADNTADQDQSTTLSRLLGRVSPEALHHLLHEFVPNTFKHGIYSSDRDAVEAVHAGNPDLASTIVHLAVRQGPSGNDTTTSDTPTSSTMSTSDTAPSTTPTVEPTTPAEMTTSPQPTPTPSLSITTTTSTSMSTPATTETSESPQTTETTEPTSSSSPPSPPSPSSLPTSESSSDVVSSSTSTFSTTTAPAPTSKTSTFTSTLPGGAVTTITEVAVVTPGVPEQNASPSTSAIGNLQHGGPATNVRGPGLPFLAGLLVGGVVLA